MTLRSSALSVGGVLAQAAALALLAGVLAWWGWRIAAPAAVTVTPATPADPAAVILASGLWHVPAAAAPAPEARKDEPAVLAGDTRLKGQILVYPMTDVVSPDDRFASRTLYGQGQHFLANAGIAFARDTYLAGSDARPGDPRISLLDAPVPAGIAAAFILTAGHDPLRDEAAAYHAQLERAGVASRYHCAGSTIHAFASFGVLDVAQDARRMLADAAREMLTKG